MNPSSLSARTARHSSEDNDPFYVSRETGRHLETPVHETPSIPDFATAAPDARKLTEDVTRLRLALARLLAHETGQTVQVFQSPAVDNARLCAIADNIWNLRRWSD